MSGKPDRVTFQARMDEMLTRLRTEIAAGIRPEGSYLPSEIVLGEQFQLSKKSVRKALDLLVKEGWITKVPRVGNRISMPDVTTVTTLRIGIYSLFGEQNDLTELLERFHRQHPHIRVETVPFPYSKYPSSIKAYLEEGFIDVFTLNNRNYRDMVEAESLHLLEPQPEPASSDFYPFLTRLFSDNGLLYALPFIFSPVILCYNKALFKKCELKEPHSGWTWDELLKNANRIKKLTGVQGFYAHIESLNRFPIFLLQSQYLFTKEKDSYRFDDPFLWDILHKCRHLFHEQGFLPAFLSESDADAEKLFKQQKVGMIMTTYYGLALMRNVSFQYDISPLPFTQMPQTLLLATGLAINRFSRHKEAARLLVEFLTTEESQSYIQQQTLSLPAHQAAAEKSGDGGSYGPSRYWLYREIVPSYADYKDLNISIDALDAFGQELKLFWAGLQDPQSIVETMKASRNGAG
jgi:multiple sugar transport system substrate-binding protein